MGRAGPEPGLPVVALAGNPNVGKSTVFNRLTGLRQHTGNWPGKTVELAWGRSDCGGQDCTVVDLPGTYSLRSHSKEEEVAAGFLEQETPDCVVIVCDATCLERNLNLAFQILERTGRAVLCVNLMDEAARRGITVDCPKLEALLGIPVVGTAADSGAGLDALREVVGLVVSGAIQPPGVRSPACIRELVEEAEAVAVRTVTRTGRGGQTMGSRLDRLLMRPLTGAPILLGLLLAVFWLTISGANLPSQLMQAGFDRLGAALWRLAADWPPLLAGMLLDGVYATAARVVAVMLPPMAIFFPLFTLAEDWGLLPRIAFLLDHRFAVCGACGKQGLTMCMGLGCNAVGVTGCRIIDSPRERLIAILTNAFVPCNGRFPAMIALITIFFAGNSPLLAALLLTAVVLLGVGMTFLASKLLSGTVLRGEPSSFALELPPYRKPDIPRVLVRSLLDRTVFVLGRAVAVAAPAGLVIWLLANLGGGAALRFCADVLDPLGLALGMNGMILLSFILALPANELVLPVLLMQLTGSGVLAAVEGTGALGALLLAGGWTWKTALCTLIFFLCHWPCSTTLLTIRRETGSLRWTALAAALPTTAGALLCLLLSLL